jgi:hypothetical protein
LILRERLPLVLATRSFLNICATNAPQQKEPNHDRFCYRRPSNDGDV